MPDDNQNLYPIDVDLTSRPIRIVFFVPSEDTVESHVLLDAVFRTGYAAWNGGYFLVVPVASGGVPFEPYREWMKALDPDWLYSYVDFPDAFINELNRDLCPMAFFRHQVRGNPNPLQPFDFLPSYEGLNAPLSSQTCLFDVSRPTGSALPTVLGAFNDRLVSRFIADNFGFTSFNRNVPGVCSVKLLCPVDLPPSHATAVDRVHEDHVIVAEIREGRLASSADLARATRLGQPWIRDHAHSEALFLTVGESVLDRVDAWNRRLLTSEHLGSAASIRISRTELSNGILSYEVAQLLLRLDYGDRMQLHVCSRTHDEMTVRRALESMTGCLAHVFRNKIRWSTIPAFPEERHSLESSQARLLDEGATTIIHKPNQAVHLPRPHHVHHLPPSFGSLNHGSWITTANLGRPEAERVAINIDPRWILPRRAAVAQLITTSPARIDRHGRVAILAHVRGARPWSEQEPLRTATVASPSVADVLGCAIIPCERSSQADWYTATPQWNREISISDKGQNLQGVVKLFGGLEHAGTFVSNSHWRSLLTRARDQAGRPVRWAPESVQVFEDRLGVLNAIVSSHGGDHASAGALLKARVRDALESFLQHRLVYRGHEWRCEYCGNSAIVGVGMLSETMTCDVCGNAYVLPLDLAFSFTWNDFLHHALITSHGLPVLWAIDQGRQQSRFCFAWMPEVLIDWRDETTNEIDYLVVSDGKLIACEAKKAVAVFLQDDPDGSKFSSVITRLGVDAAVLAFERVGQEPEDLLRLRQEIERIAGLIQSATGIQISVIIAEETPLFRDPPTHFGAFGTRELRLHR